jgi:hypothetical protein
LNAYFLPLLIGCYAKLTSSNIDFLNQNVREPRAKKWFDGSPIGSQPLNDDNSSSFEKAWDFGASSDCHHKLF